MARGGINISGRVAVFTFLGLAAALAAGRAHAATLTVSSVADAAPGQALVEAAVLLENAAYEEVSGIETDVEFDPAVLQLKSVSVGAAASDAGKKVSSNILDSGIVRVIVTGLNQDAIGDGDVAVISFSVLADAAAGVFPVTLSDPRLVSPTGAEVSVEAVAGSVTVVATGEGEGEGEGHIGCLGAPPGVKHRQALDEWAALALAIGLFFAVRVVRRSKGRE
jgi:hypothetical protein